MTGPITFVVNRSFYAQHRGSCRDTFTWYVTGPSASTEGRSARSPGKTAYFCPMHPEVFSDKPGRCPKCNMFLEKHKAS